ncbi:hypothetical protein ACH4M4_32420 [Streptomyces sp. NPDC017254]|uniref:hypothetical protein n=1 Tax=unclassified Streptomyces TaxID=2593676 RepID=UPI0037B3C87D
MRSYTGVLIGNLVFAAFCGLAGPVFLVVGYTTWVEGAEWFWVALSSGIGVVGTVMIPVSAVKAARQGFPRITRRDHMEGLSPVHGDDTLVVWAPRSAAGPANARLVRADVLEASFVRYDPDTEATFTTYTGNHDPAEVKPLIRMRLRVHGTADTGTRNGSVDPTGSNEPGGSSASAESTGSVGSAGFAGFEIAEEVRVPPLCLSAVSAGRLAVLVDPSGTSASRKVTVLWPRSLLLAGTRTCRVIDLEGQLTDVTRRAGRQLEQMRISLSVGGIVMAGDLIDLRLMDADTAARYAAVARAFAGEERAPAAEPGEESRLLADHLPGETGAFGSVGRRWSRRGGHLVRARFLEMRGRTTFQADGPVLDTLMRVRPADGTPSFDVSRRLTVPMNYLTVLHHSRDVVLRVGVNGRSQVVDWARTNLLAGVTTAQVITPDGRRISLPRRSEALWPLMNLLVTHSVSNPTPVLDLRKPRTHAVSGAVMEVLRGTGVNMDGARL